MTDSNELDIVVLPGNIILDPSKYNNYIRVNIFDACVKKYTGKIIQIQDKYAVITRIKNIKQNSITSKNNRNSNLSSMRIYFKMVVSIFYPLEENEIECTVSSLNTDYIEASIYSTKKVVLIIFIDDTNINKSNMYIKNSKIFNKTTQKPIGLGDSILCKINTIMPNIPDLFIFAQIENIIQ